MAPARDPIGTFNLAVQLFNNHQWPQLRALLHGNVILDHLHTNGKAEFGLGRVIAALQASNAQMLNITPNPPNWDGHNGLSGNANWVVGANSEPIQFYFLFTDDGNNNWIIHHLYGLPTNPPSSFPVD
jgi:hypothetical protein